jgi:ParB family chromosome partitioning protein
MKVLGVREVPVSKIVVRPELARRIDEEKLSSLVKSIESTCGPLQPIVVRLKDDKYELVCGYRRYLAATKLGLSTITAVLIECTDEEAIALSIVENVEREDMSDYEIALRLKELRDRFGLSTYQVAQLLGKSQPWIEHHLRMLELEREVAEVARTIRRRIVAPEVMDKLTAYHAEVILKQPEPVRKKLIEEIVERVAKGEEPPSARALERAARVLAEAEKVKKVEKEAEKAEVEAEAEVEEVEEEKPEEKPKVLYRAEIRTPEDVDKFFDQILKATPTAPTPTPATTAVAEPSGIKATIDILNSRLNELDMLLSSIEALCSKLTGHKVRITFEDPREGELADIEGVVSKADKKALYIGEKHKGVSVERMFYWPYVKKVELL